MGFFSRSKSSSTTDASTHTTTANASTQGSTDALSIGNSQNVTVLDSSSRTYTDHGAVNSAIAGVGITAGRAIDGMDRTTGRAFDFAGNAMDQVGNNSLEAMRIVSEFSGEAMNKSIVMADSANKSLERFSGDMLAAVAGEETKQTKYIQAFLGLGVLVILYAAVKGGA